MASSRVMKRERSGLMLMHEAGERVADHQAHVDGRAGILHRRAAGTIEGHDAVGILHHDRARPLVGDNLLQVGQFDLFINQYQLPGQFKRHDLAVISVREADSLFGSFVLFGFVIRRSKKFTPFCKMFRSRVLTLANSNVQISPASVDVAVEKVSEGIARGIARFLDKCARRWFQKWDFHGTPL